MVEVSYHVWFCAMTGNTARGLEIVERHLPWLDVAPSPLAELRFATRAALLLRRAPGQHRLHRPGHGARTGAPVTAAALGEELATRALELAGTAWGSAIGLYSEAGDELRRQIARGRLGLGWCVTNRGEAGLPMVEEATAYVLAHGGLDRRTGAFMSLSAAYGAVGRHDEG